MPSWRRRDKFHLSAFWLDVGRGKLPLTVWLDIPCSSYEEKVHYVSRVATRKRIILKCRVTVKLRECTVYLRTWLQSLQGLSYISESCYQNARTLGHYTKMETRLKSKGQGDQKHPSDLRLKTFRLSTRLPKLYRDP
jgi:hypothetical protein